MKEQIQYRTKQLALAIIKLADHLSNNRVGWTFTDRILRSSSSVASVKPLRIISIKNHQFQIKNQKDE